MNGNGNQVQMNSTLAFGLDSYTVYKGIVR